MLTLLALVLVVALLVWGILRVLKHRSPVVWIVAAAALALAFYAGSRLLTRAVHPDYQDFITPTWAEAQQAGTLLGTYRARPLVPDAPAVEAAFAFVPTRKVLGPLLGPRTIRAEAVGLSVRMPDPGRYELAFEDRNSVLLQIDGRAQPAPPRPAPVEGLWLEGCCFAYRSRLPERFWLVRDDTVRVVAFDRSG